MWLAHGSQVYLGRGLFFQTSTSILSWIEALVALTSMDFDVFADDAGGTVALAFADNA